MCGAVVSKLSLLSEVAEVAGVGDMTCDLAKPCKPPNTEWRAATLPRFQIKQTQDEDHRRMRPLHNAKKGVCIYETPDQKCDHALELVVLRTACSLRWARKKCAVRRCSVFTLSLLHIILLSLLSLSLSLSSTSVRCLSLHPLSLASTFTTL